MSQELGPVQVIPPGLLGLLQLKNGGIGLSTLDTNMLGVVELRDWLMQARMVDEVSLYGGVAPVANVNIPGDYPFANNRMTTPQNAWMYVDYVSANCATGAAEAIRGQLGLVLNASTTFSRNYFTPETDSGAAGAKNVVFGLNQRGFWMPPNAELIFHCTSITTAGNIVVSGHMRGCLLPV